MSWSIQKTIGKPEAVRPAVDAAFDAAAKQYEGKTEADDVLAAKTAVGEWLAESACSDKEGVCVEASGSRGQGWLSIKVDCAKVTLLV